MWNSLVTVEMLMWLRRGWAFFQVPHLPVERPDFPASPRPGSADYGEAEVPGKLLGTSAPASDLGNANVLDILNG